MYIHAHTCNWNIGHLLYLVCTICMYLGFAFLHEDGGEGCLGAGLLGIGGLLGGADDGVGLLGGGGLGGAGNLEFDCLGGLSTDE